MLKRVASFALFSVTAAVIAVALILSPARAAADDTAITQFTLANGLSVVVIPDHRVPVVTHMVWYKVGSADETAGTSGIAHFLEHLMFKGTAKNPSGKFSQVLATIGGQENAFTTSDYTGYFQRIAKEHLGTVMAFEADRMTGLVLTDENVLPERDVVLEEYNMRVANSPDARLGEQVSAALFLNHPYGRPVIGWRKEIEKLSREDALAFYHRFYAPNNAIVVVAGDVNADEVKKLAEDTYGKVERRPDVGPRVRPQEPEPVAVRHVMLADPRAAQPSLQRSYLVPCEVKAKPGEAEALDLLSHILGNGQNSRLYRELVEDKRVAVNAGTNYQGTSVDDTTFSIYATPRPGVSLEELESAIDGVIAELVDAGITATELERAKTRMIADAVYARDSQATMARWYGSSLAVGETIEQVQGWPDRVRAVDAEAVRNAARTWLTKQRSVTGYLVKELPAEGDKKAANGDKREKKT